MASLCSGTLSGGGEAWRASSYRPRGPGLSWVRLLPFLVFFTDGEDGDSVPVFLDTLLFLT